MLLPQECLHHFWKVAHFELLYRFLLSCCVITLRLSQALLVEFSLAVNESCVELVPLALHMRFDDVDWSLQQLVSFSLCVLEDALDFAALPVGSSDWMRLGHRVLEGARTHVRLRLLLVSATEHRLVVVHLGHLWRWPLLGVSDCTALAA